MTKIIQLTRADQRSYRQCYYDLMQEIEELELQQQLITENLISQIADLGRIIQSKKEQMINIDGAITAQYFNDSKPCINQALK